MIYGCLWKCGVLRGFKKMQRFLPGSRILLVRFLNRFTRVQCLLDNSEKWKGLSETVCVLLIRHNYNRC